MGRPVCLPFRRGRIVQISRRGTHRPLAKMQAEDHYLLAVVEYRERGEGGVRAQEDDDSGGCLDYLDREANEIVSEQRHLPAEVIIVTTR